MPSENGWEPAQASADQCEWVTVPGTNVTLQLLKGQPSALLRAWAADWNAFVEPLRDADSAGWTPTNSVPTSNHLNGTAIDLDWNSHPMGPHAPDDPAAGLTVDQVNTIREMLAFYTLGGVQMVWWGNDWDVPHDSMHTNCGYNTYGNPLTQQFIDRFIRADGFSTFRRSGAVPLPVLSKSDGYAVLIIQEGQRRGITPRGIEIALATGLVESNLQIYANAAVPASMSIPHDAVGSDAYSVGIFQQQVRDTGNGWWWGDAQTCMDPTSSAGLFYGRLAALDYNGPNSPGSYAQAVQDSAYPTRYDERFNDAVALYNRLLTTPTTELDEWEALMADETKDTSRSIYRTSNDKTMTARDAVFGADATSDMNWVEQNALRGELWAIDLVSRTASGTGAGSYLWNDPTTVDQWAVAQATNVLSLIEQTNPAALQQFLKNGVSA